MGSGERQDSQSNPDAPSGPPPSGPPTMLCSLRIVPVSSEHFRGSRYVMELSTTGRARELRIYRSLEHLARGMAELGLRQELRDGLHRQLLEEGRCDVLDLVL